MSNYMNRAEHIAWCKERALKYVDSGDTAQAITSMLSDLKNHPDTENHGAIELGAMMLLSGNLRTETEIREFIEGFN